MKYRLILFRYELYSMEELDVRLKSLDEEENDQIQLIKNQYKLAKDYIQERLRNHEEAKTE